LIVEESGIGGRSRELRKKQMQVCELFEQLAQARLLGVTAEDRW
jgi:hypothetical protein